MYIIGASAIIGAIFLAVFVPIPVPPWGFVMLGVLITIAVIRLFMDGMNGH